MTREEPCDTGSGHCITCGDEGIAMRVSESQPDGIAICVDSQNERHAVATDLLESVEEGDTVLIHAGVAIAKLGAAR